MSLDPIKIIIKLINSFVGELAGGGSVAVAEGVSNLGQVSGDAQHATVFQKIVHNVKTEILPKIKPCTKNCPYTALHKLDPTQN